MKYLFLVCALLCFQLSYSKTLPDFDAITLEKATDYKPAEPSVLTAANYVFATPYKEDDADRIEINRFLIKWMSGTPDYNFELDESVAKITKGSNDMLALYMAAMVKYVLENPASAKDKDEIKQNALNTIIGYCENPKNNFKMTKGLKKYADNRRKA